VGANRWRYSIHCNAKVFYSCSYFTVSKSWLIYVV
jgi:hypothetical protein